MKNIETEPEYGVTYNRSWAITAIAHPAVPGEHGDCVRCLQLEAIDEAVRTGQRTATIERDGHAKTVHEMIGTSGSYYRTPEERAQRDEDRRLQAALVASGASAQDLRRRAEGLSFLCRVCSRPVEKPGTCEDCAEGPQSDGIEIHDEEN